LDDAEVRYEEIFSFFFVPYKWAFLIFIHTLSISLFNHIEGFFPFILFYFILFILFYFILFYFIFSVLVEKAIGDHFLPVDFDDARRTDRLIVFMSLLTEKAKSAFRSILERQAWYDSLTSFINMTITT